MVPINEHYSKLHRSYLFAEIAERVRVHSAAHPDRDIIRLGIGDTTRALPAAVVAAFSTAVQELGADATYRGYGPEEGYDFLREAIAAADFGRRAVSIKPDEIFISDSAKCDSTNFQELLSPTARIAVPDPIYPAYVDSNVMAGRSGAWDDGRYAGIHYLESTVENGFVPAPPEEAVDVAYLCFPNNPTGAVATREQLAGWVEWARRQRALILFDAAYVEFIRDEHLPHSIFEIEGADEVAVEFRSLSKTAGFTGVRCAYTIVPRRCRAWDSSGQPHSLHTLWKRRVTTKFNGVGYPVQRAAEAVFQGDGGRQAREISDGYLENARLILHEMRQLGYVCYGGEHSPYIWVDCNGLDSWEMFERLLTTADVVTTPGDGFGRCGRGFIRISAFNDREHVLRALERIRSAIRNSI